MRTHIIHTNVHIRISILINMRRYTHTHTHIRTRVSAHLYIYLILCRRVFRKLSGSKVAFIYFWNFNGVVCTRIYPQTRACTVPHTNTHTHIHPLPRQPIVYTRGLDIFLDYRTRRTQCENLLFDFITQCFIYYVRIRVPPSTCAWLCVRFLFLFFFL
jgi:hypothetical protein